MTRDDHDRSDRFDRDALPTTRPPNGRDPARGVLGAPLTSLTALLLLCHASESPGQDGKPVHTAHIERGELSVTFRDNSESPPVLSGIDSLFNTEAAPEYDAYDPESRGASAGLNFEHIISGSRNPNNKFTPRHGKYTLHASPDGATVTLERRAEDSPWKVASTLEYKVVEPHYVDFEFRCSPRDAALFGPRGYAIFFFANYMNDVEDASLHFRGRESADGPEQWIAADAPKGHPDWNGGGNYRSLGAADLEVDDGVEFRLNTWSYDWPRITKPFCYGRAGQGMTLILMFDRLYSPRDQIRFSLYKFKLPKHPRPAWDFQYVINDVKTDEHYGFRGRLVWKKFVDADDCQREYRQWRASLDAERAQVQAERVRRLRRLGATVFLRGDEVVEVNANRTPITDEDLEAIADFTRLTDLSLEGTRIGDAGLVHLRKLQKLEWLNLYRCPIGDAGLRELKGLGNLRHLPIGESKVTDAGLIHLRDMRRLVYLGLRGVDVTDVGLKHLRPLTNLQGLYLGETEITDAGLAHLLGMTKLRKLWLNDTAVSDDAVQNLARLDSLRELHVVGSNITDAGLERLRASLPGCRVVAKRE